MNELEFNRIIENQLIWRRLFNLQKKHRKNILRLKHYKYDTDFRPRLSRDKFIEKIKNESDASEKEIEMLLLYYK